LPSTIRMTSHALSGSLQAPIIPAPVCFPEGGARRFGPIHGRRYRGEFATERTASGLWQAGPMRLRSTLPALATLHRFWSISLIASAGSRNGIHTRIPPVTICCGYPLACAVNEVPHHSAHQTTATSISSYHEATDAEIILHGCATVRAILPTMCDQSEPSGNHRRVSKIGPRRGKRKELDAYHSARRAVVAIFIARRATSPVHTGNCKTRRLRLRQATSVEGVSFSTP